MWILNHRRPIWFSDQRGHLRGRSISLRRYRCGIPLVTDVVAEPWLGWSVASVTVCLCSLKGKKLELSTPNLVDIQCMAVVWHTLTRMSKHRGHAVIIECAASLGDASRYDCIGFYYCRRVQVKIDWESINAKVDAEYKHERERPSAVLSQPRT